MSLSLLATATGLIVLFLILWSLLRHGVPALSADFFTKDTPAPGNVGGLRNAFYGSFMMTLVGTLVGAPIGILAGTFLAEYARGSHLGQAVRFINDILLSAPSIVIGVFVNEVMVVRMGHFSAWAGAASLAIILVPVVVRTTENMLTLVPASLRE
ncbi:MAG: ABC transporter permease subunit, partial [Alphaproteobacteria bacterium]|nr:ABC transporter permease subunit [Alphaproteobacteria bacterium]